MMLAWSLLLALSASPADAGSEPVPEPLLEGPRQDCKAPGYWDPKARECRAGCGIPLRWENGVQVGGCGRNDQLIPEEPRPVCRPGTVWSEKKKRCEKGPKP